ncbi:hypothetical protein C8F01DRAFT_1138112 [Mycena amicta]|nr:hypothetical protein C8F01DRAFT_1138112 [Mycena amicta]
MNCQEDTNSFSLALYGGPLAFFTELAPMRFSFLVRSRARLKRIPSGVRKSLPSHSSSSHALPDILRTSLVALRESADACPPLKSAMGAAVALWDIAEVSTVAFRTDAVELTRCPARVQRMPRARPTILLYPLTRSWITSAMRFPTSTAYLRCYCVRSRSWLCA